MLKPVIHKPFKHAFLKVKAMNADKKLNKVMVGIHATRSNILVRWTQVRVVANKGNFMSRLHRILPLRHKGFLA